jgi:hypothetical protein
MLYWDSWYLNLLINVSSAHAIHVIEGWRFFVWHAFLKVYFLLILNQTTSLVLLFYIRNIVRTWLIGFWIYFLLVFELVSFIIIFISSPWRVKTQNKPDLSVCQYFFTWFAVNSFDSILINKKFRGTCILSACLFTVRISLN